MEPKGPASPKTFKMKFDGVIPLEGTGCCRDKEKRSEPTGSVPVEGALHLEEEGCCDE